MLNEKLKQASGGGNHGGYASECGVMLGRERVAKGSQWVVYAEGEGTERSNEREGLQCRDGREVTGCKSCRKVARRGKTRWV